MEETREEGLSMADPFARIKVLGGEVACYLRPGTECDNAALARDINGACAGCGSEAELRARVKSVAESHGLDVEYHTSAPVAHDPVERLVSMGFYPRA
jgi:hypothetical protein